MFEESGRKRFVGQIDLGCDSQGRRIRPKVVGRTRKEAVERLAKLKKLHTDGVDVTQRAVTFRDAVGLWLHRGLPGDVAENTRWNYERVLNGHVIPVLGDKRLLDIRSDDVEEMLDVMVGAGMAASSMRHALNLTRRVLRFAMSRDLVARNVAEPVQTRRGPRAERYGMTVEQAKHLIEVARGDRLANLVIVSLLLGLRPGEAAGLTWQHVNLEGPRPTITIAASLRRAPDGTLSLVGPKTPTSRRTLEIPPPVVAALDEQRELQVADQHSSTGSWSNLNNLVFTSESGSALDPSNVRRTFSRLAVLAGLEHLHPHMLRHAAASLLSAAGVPIEDISDTLGHRSVAVTAEVYRHPIAPVRSGHMVAMSQLIDTTPRAVADETHA
ncbi:tyrosine-type recombinase/integrase [Actinotalea sp. K2]|nr:tyrosine-type recombinase/integrase [Actinotalea sp. K2]